MSNAAIVRASVLDVVPERALSMAADLRGTSVDIPAGGNDPIRQVDVQASVGADALLTAFSASYAPVPDLVGRSAGRGFRAALDPLAQHGAPGRQLRRLLWDLPILVQVAGQTALLDHGRARAEMQLSRRGTDQCSGWRAEGQMMRQIDRNAGVLVMPLGPITIERSLAARWIPSLPDLPPMATRRSRVLWVEPRDANRVDLTVQFRDSYADPDGIQRALHEWTIRTSLVGEGDAATFAEFAIDAGRLPWVECPIAGGSANRISGRAPAEVEAAVGAEFAGISTCTHLNDTLRTLAEVTDLLPEPAIRH